MMENLTTIKKLSKEWGSNKRSLEQKELKEIEQKIQNLHSSNIKGVFFAQEEKISRLKSRALWLEVGDKNTKYFHRFDSHKEKINTIL